MWAERCRGPRTADVHSLVSIRWFLTCCLSLYDHQCEESPPSIRCTPRVTMRSLVHATLSSLQFPPLVYMRTYIHIRLFCHTGTCRTGISLRRAMIFRARLHLTADIRRGSCDIEELDDRRTLDYFEVESGAVLHVAVAPALSDMLAPCPTNSPPHSSRPYYSCRSRRGCRAGVGGADGAMRVHGPGVGAGEGLSNGSGAGEASRGGDEEGSS